MSFIHEATSNIRHLKTSMEDLILKAECIDANKIKDFAFCSIYLSHKENGFLSQNNK